MNQPPSALFSEQIFFVSPMLSGREQIRALLAQNGGRLTERAEESDVYITEAFESQQPLIEELISKGKRVFSPRVIHESIEAKKPLPHPDHPLFARFLENVSVAIDDSCPASKRSGLLTLLRYMGARVLSEADVHRADYLVAKKVGSLAYQVAAQRNIPVLRPRWVKECWFAQCHVNPTPLRLPPFAGLAISVTGLSPSTREEVSRLAHAFGGEYMANMTRRCTHLLAFSAEGIKYRYALEWGIHCVTTQWFFDSINAHRALDERLYLVPLTPEKREALFSPSSTSLTDIARLSPALRKRHLSELGKPPHANLKPRSPSRTSVHLTPGQPSVQVAARPLPSDPMDLDGPLHSALMPLPRHVLEQIQASCAAVLDSYRSLPVEVVAASLAQLTAAEAAQPDKR